MNRTPAQWAEVNPAAVVAGSSAQAQNVMRMMLDDIAEMAREIQRLEMQMGAVEFAYQDAR